MNHIEASEKVMLKALRERPWVRKLHGSTFRVTPRTRNHGVYRVELFIGANGEPTSADCWNIYGQHPCDAAAYGLTCYHVVAACRRWILNRRRSSAVSK